MIPRPRARPQGLLQAVTRPTCLSSQLAQSPLSRSLHSVPELANGKDAVFKKYGVPGFLSPAAYEETWTQYQSTLCKSLNDEVAGTTLENTPVKKLHIDTSKQPSKAVLYNHAAQAHHNHFFFNGLSSLPDPYPPAQTIVNTVTEWFESMDHLRDEMTDMAMSMFGNGYVWLLSEERSSADATRGVGGALRLLCTYNAGSPFAEAHARRQAVDGNTKWSAVTQNMMAGSMGDHSSNRITSQPREVNGQPVLCVKIWEHQWMRDYGLGGKEAYLQNWWNRVDWNEVHARLNVVGSAAARKSPIRPVNTMTKDAGDLYRFGTNLPVR